MLDDIRAIFIEIDPFVFTYIGLFLGFVGALSIGIIHLVGLKPKSNYANEKENKNLIDLSKCRDKIFLGWALISISYLLQALTFFLLNWRLTIH